MKVAHLAHTSAMCPLFPAPQSVCISVNPVELAGSTHVRVKDFQQTSPWLPVGSPPTWFCWTFQMFLDWMDQILILISFVTLRETSSPIHSRSSSVTVSHDELCIYIVNIQRQEEKERETLGHHTNTHRHPPYTYSLESCLKQSSVKSAWIMKGKDLCHCVKRVCLL